MSNGFVAGKIYELSQEWKTFYDTYEISGECFPGYYYVMPATDEFKNDQLVSCIVINKEGYPHPSLVGEQGAPSIPFKFSDVKLSSLSSSAKLKLFKIWITEEVEVALHDSYTDAVVIATDAEQAKTIHPNDIDVIPDEFSAYTWANQPDQVEVKYLKDYYGSQEADTVICASKID
jgi:hypothetical protein